MIVHFLFFLPRAYLVSVVGEPMDNCAFQHKWHRSTGAISILWTKFQCGLVEINSTTAVSVSPVYTGMMPSFVSTIPISGTLSI